MRRCGDSVFQVMCDVVLVKHIACCMFCVVLVKKLLQRAE